MPAGARRLHPAPWPTASCWANFRCAMFPSSSPNGPGVHCPSTASSAPWCSTRFLFTLDYPGGRLVLRRNTPEQSKAVQAESKKAGAFRMPFWLAGDHFIFARGTANGAGPYLFHVDSGMAGGGFSCPEYVVKEANIELPKQGFQGMGGGGPITVYPFTVDLTLGDARQTGVRGLNGALPPGSEDRFGFRTGGSHLPRLLSAVRGDLRFPGHDALPAATRAGR